MPVEGVYNTIDAWVVRDGRSLTILITNHAQPRQPIATEPMNLSLLNAPAPQDVYVERIDDAHSNPDHRCTEIGEPIYLTTSEIDQLKEVSGTVRFDIDLPPDGVVGITMECPEGRPEDPDARHHSTCS